MLILAIETTGPYASVALTDGTEYRMLTNDSDYSHLQETVPMVKKLMEQENAKPEELSAVAVSRGPGSFTGVRIGMATAKGLAQIWDKPVICVPTLESFAYSEPAPDPETVIAPIFDARRSQTYAAAYVRYADGAVTELVPGAAYDTDSFFAMLGSVMSEHAELKRVEFFGDGTKAFAGKLEAFGYPCGCAPENSRFQTADRVARLSVKMYTENRVTDTYGCEPDYMRLPEAERKLKEKLAAQEAEAAK